MYKNFNRNKRSSVFIFAELGQKILIKKSLAGPKKREVFNNGVNLFMNSHLYFHICHKKVLKKSREILYHISSILQGT